jgi:integrase
VRCRETLKLPPTASNLRYAERLKGEVENAIERGTFDYRTLFPQSRRARMFIRRPGDVVTVTQALREFIAGAEKRVAWSTYLGWRNDVEQALIP